MPAREKVVAELRTWMHAQVGVQEKPRGSNKQRYGKKYGWNGVPWCVIFTWCGCQAVGLPSKHFPKTAAVAEVRRYAKKHGRWGSKPKVGAFGLYPGGSSHIFWVDKILSGGRVQTVEGNTNSDGSREGFTVAKRIRSASNVAGYFYPRYAEADLPSAQFGAAAVAAPAKPAISRVLKLRPKNMRGADVKRVQKKVGAGADGVFGEDTDKEVKAFQKKRDLLADGDVGEDTARALGFVWKGGKS